MKKNKVGIVVNNFDYASGVTTYIINLIKELEDDLDIYLFTSPGSAVNELRSKKIKIYEFEYLNFENRSYLNYLKAVVKLTFLFHKHDLKIIHSNDHYTASMLEYVKKFRRLINVRTIHSWSDENSKLNKKAGDIFICVNHHLKQILLENNISDESIEIIFNGVDFGEEIKTETKEKSDNINLLAAARLVYEKGIQNIIKAVGSLEDDYKDKVVLRIAGKGQYQNQLIGLTEELKLSNIIFLDEVDNIEQYYKQADIFIFSSLIDWFGYTNIEAVKHDCFIITSNFDGIKYIFKDNVDGFIYDKDSYLDLSKKLKHAIDIGDSRFDYIKRFKSKCAEKFNSKIMASKTMDVYKSCMKKIS
jgi:glycosyltransferase involved in cell wall biosynthesis